MALSIDNTYLTNYYSTDVSDVTASTLTSSIENASTDEETMEACQEFEAYMLEQMFKSMEEASKVLTEDDDEDDSSSDYVDMFSDNYYQSIAEQMVNSGQGLGIAEQLYNSIQSQQGTTAAAETAETAATAASAE
jgi:Rod binding domain-containing protein